MDIIFFYGHKLQHRECKENNPPRTVEVNVLNKKSGEIEMYKIMPRIE